MTHQLQHTEQSSLQVRDKCTELQANLDSAKASLAELLARLNDNDPDAQLKYWKGEAERLAEKARAKTAAKDSIAGEDDGRAEHES